MLGKKLLSKAGRETLVKIVLWSQPIYHLTVFPVQKWLIRSIDKTRRGFLWKGAEHDGNIGVMNTTSRLNIPQIWNNVLNGDNFAGSSQICPEV